MPRFPGVDAEANQTAGWFCGAAPGRHLLYSREAYMSVSVMQVRSVNFASPGGLQAPAEEKLAAFDTYSSYSGRYEVRGQKVIHHVEISLFPNWTGKA